MANRQCSIGYHEECSDPNGYECDCNCHKYLERVESVGYLLAVLIRSGDVEMAKDVAGQFIKIVDESPFNG
jgi:hypothetical protein